MEHWRVVIHEVYGHLVPGCILHSSGTWLWYFEIVELLRIKSGGRGIVRLRNPSILLGHPLLVLLLLELLFDGGLIYQGRGLRLARRVLLLPLGTLLYC